MQQRAYSLLTVKSIDEERREITGIATTPTPDREGDIVEPKGAEFKLPIPLLWQHNSREPVGQVVAAKVTAAGIEIKAKLVAIAEPGKLKDRLDEAWQSIKSGLVKGLSIGFIPLESAQIKDTFSFHILKWSWLELSAVTIPANADASILSIKQYDETQRAASGRARGGVVRLADPPGASGTTDQPAKSGLFVDPTKGNTVKTISETISAFETSRAAKVARRDEVQNKASEEGRTKDEAEREEFKTLDSDISSIDEELVDLRRMEAGIASKATVVTQAAGASAQSAAEIRGGVISVRRNVDKGIPFVRFALAMVAAKGNTMMAAKMAERWKDTPEVANCLNFSVEHGSAALVEKTAVAAGTTQDATWAAPLVQYQDMASEFIELLRPMTILGKLSLRRVPFNIRIQRQTAGVTGAFVGEGAPKPVNKMAFDTITMAWAKAAVIVVLTDELVRFSNPSAEALAREDMLAGVAEYLDKRFIDPTYAGVANVSPASITNGITPREATGVTIAAITADVKAMVTGFVNANLSLSRGAWIMSPKSALGLGMMRNATTDEFSFPGLGVNGGTFFGMPVITSGSVGLSGSPTDSFVVLLDQSEILLADDGQISIDMSQEASLQMNDAPSAGAQSLVSLWQNNMIGLRAERYINWQRRRDAAVAVLNSTNY